MMHHRCSGSCHGTMVGGPCSCGLFYGGHHNHHQSNNNNNSFSMLFSSMPNSGGYEAHDAHYHQPYDETDMYSFESSSPSSSVDCTLSLGTPSTRLSNDTSNHEKSRRSNSNSRMSNFCWDILQSKQSKQSSRGSNGGAGSNSAGSETLLARRCANCDTTSTPLWRNGPKGPKSLCNACGIRFKKEERRASAAAAAAGNGGSTTGAAVDAQHMLNSSWVHHHQYSSSQNHQKMPYISSAYDGNEFRIVEDDDRDSDAAGIPYLSWRLNVTDRPAGLIHEFTR